MQSLAAQDGGLKLFEQQCDQHMALAIHPWQNQALPSIAHVSPLLLLQAIPHTLQLESVFVSTGLPPQQRATWFFVSHW
jgi:hypothetical protein